MSDMDRKKARELFSAYLEGDIGAADRRELERYLGVDAQARAELESFRSTLESLSRLRGPLQVPSEFTRKVEGKIRVRSRGRFFSDKMLARLPFEWISFIIILVLLVFYLVLVIDTRPTRGSGQGPRDRGRTPSSLQRAP